MDKAKYLDNLIKIDEINLLIIELRQKRELLHNENFEFIYEKKELPPNYILPKYVRFEKKLGNSIFSVFRYREDYNDYYVDKGDWSFDYRFENDKLVIHSIISDVIAEMDGGILVECDINGRYYNEKK